MAKINFHKLELTERQSSRDEQICTKSIADILQGYAAGTYTVLIHCDYALVWGYYDSSTKIFTFADVTTPLSDFEDTYVLQMRLFNETEEILLQRQYKNYRVRKICDHDDGRMIDIKTVLAYPKKGYVYTVDSSSMLYGTKIQDLSHGFCKLKDKNRKIDMIIAVQKTNSERYALTTRSYIDYDGQTGLAGYSDYRYVSVDPVAE